MCHGGSGIIVHAVQANAEAEWMLLHSVAHSIRQRAGGAGDHRWGSSINLLVCTGCAKRALSDG